MPGRGRPDPRWNLVGGVSPRDRRPGFAQHLLGAPSLDGRVDRGRPGPDLMRFVSGFLNLKVDRSFGEFDPSYARSATQYFTMQSKIIFLRGIMKKIQRITLIF